MGTLKRLVASTRHWYSPGVMKICCGSWNVFSFSLLDEPFSLILTVPFIRKYVNIAKSTCRFSNKYSQPTIYENPSSPTFTEGVERNFGGPKDKNRLILILIFQTIYKIIFIRDFRIKNLSPVLHFQCSIPLDFWHPQGVSKCYIGFKMVKDKTNIE